MTTQKNTITPHDKASTSSTWYLCNEKKRKVISLPVKRDYLWDIIFWKDKSKIAYIEDGQYWLVDVDWGKETINNKRVIACDGLT